MSKTSKRSWIFRSRMPKYARHPRIHFRRPDTTCFMLLPRVGFVSSRTRSLNRFSDFDEIVALSPFRPGSESNVKPRKLLVRTWATSWFTRSKNFAKSTSTTMTRRLFTYPSASRVAPCALRPGLKLWLCDENVGSRTPVFPIRF